VAPDGAIANAAFAELPNEAALVVSSVSEPTAFSAIYEHYFPRVYTYIRYRIREVQTADDIAAQVFERALAKIGDYRSSSGPFGAWLFAIARNAVSDHHRSRRRRRILSLGLLGETHDHTPTPESAMILDERRSALMAAVSRLGDRERDIIGLRFAAGLNNKAVAGLTGLSENNVAVIVFRVLERLRADLASMR